MILQHHIITVLTIACLITSSAHADRFLLSTFNNGEQKLRVLNSTNAASFQGYERGIAYTPPSGNNLRDPSIIFYRGRYLLCHTTGDFGAVNYFSVLTSTDANTWTHLTNVSMAAIGDVRWTWAPEWFLDDDGSLHVFVSASMTEQISTKHKIYELHPLDPDDLTHWSVPVPVTGDAAFPPWTDDEVGRVGAYDPYIVKRGDAYWIFFFNSRSSYIELACSTNSLTGPYEPVKTGNWQGIGSYKEGPTVIYLGGNRWRMIYADAIRSYLSYIDSTNNWQTWTPPQQLSLPDAPTNFTVNHGTLIIPPGGLELDLKATTQEAGQINLNFNATENDHYRLSTRTNLLLNWHPSTIIGPTTNGPVSLQIETSGTKQFWRLERLTPP